MSTTSNEAPAPTPGAERSRRWRRRQGVKPQPPPAGCPSYAAFRRHERRVAAGRPSDCTDPEGCRQAYNAYHRAMRVARGG